MVHRWSLTYLPITVHKSFGVLHFIDGTSTSADQASDEWGKLDSLQLKDVFHDNKNVRAMQLDNDLRTIEIENLVSYVINGLGDCFDQVVGIIHHRDPTPTFAQTQSMLLLEESRLARKSSRHSDRDTSSSGSVLLATNSNNRNTSNNNPSQQVRRNYQRRHCNFGNRCKYLHVPSNDTRSGTSGGSSTCVSAPQWGHMGHPNSTGNTHSVRFMARLNPTNRIRYVRGSLLVAPVVTNGNVLGGEQTPHVAYPNGSNGI
ncbi:hybrid signal transduction histidine kinase M, partial [Tanacetum coccineum]